MQALAGIFFQMHPRDPDAFAIRQGDMSMLG